MPTFAVMCRTKWKNSSFETCSFDPREKQQLFEKGVYDNSNYNKSVINEYRYSLELY